MRPLAFLAALPLTLAACNQQSSDRADPSVTASAGETTATATQPAGPAPSPTDTAGIPEGGIPVSVQGDWGLTTADCSRPRGDNTGLLRITATSLQFYESLGRLGAIRQHSDTSIAAEFEFTGEGAVWNAEENLQVSGNKLVRNEKRAGEPGYGAPVTYTKCAA